MLNRLRIPALIVAAALVFSGLTNETDAASNGPLKMEILVNGMNLTEYNARGTTYIEAQKDAEYSIRLTNTEGTRLAVALAVDGRNTIDAKRTSASKASGCLLLCLRTITNAVNDVRRIAASNPARISCSPRCGTGEPG